MTTLVVTYPVKDGATFDARYYVARHIPLVREKWTQYGLTSARALIPEVPGAAYYAIAILDFTDASAADRAIGSPEAPDVMGDVANFTNQSAVVTRCVER
ncbi:uncharacterized protein (TIGR02118 family) [Sphingomonas sp. UYAg733]